MKKGTRVLFGIRYVKGKMEKVSSRQFFSREMYSPAPIHTLCFLNQKYRVVAFDDKFIVYIQQSIWDGARDEVYHKYIKPFNERLLQHKVLKAVRKHINNNDTA